MGMKKLILVLAILIISNKSNAAIYPINFDAAINVTCQSGDTIRFYTINYTAFIFDVYINYNLIASNLTPGLNGKIYDYVAQIGNTSYQLTNSFGLTLDKSITVNNIVSIQNYNSINTYNISPNPFSTSTQISFDKTYQTLDLSLIDLQGKIIQQKSYHDCNKINLDRAGIATGFYFLRVSLIGKFVETKKVVVAD